jgi:4-hydroxythreonine-4-phosphate dehydrogenase
MIRLSVTAGCPRGVGPEVLSKALQAPIPGARITVLAPPDLLAPVDEAVRFAPPDAPPDDADRFTAAALAALTRRAMAGEADAIVTGPVRKAALDHLAPGLPGQTEWCHRQLAADDDPPLMTFAGGPFLLGLATAHLPLREVPDAITPALLRQKCARLIEAARAVTGRDHPRVVVLGLNPHAGEGGRLGHEERDVIGPALEGLENVVGPVPADGFFTGRPAVATTNFVRRGEEIDAVLAMYHDQGLAPYKPLCGRAGVNLTWGLTTPRTSPDHGTADDIAGQGVADPRSMRAALELAAKLATSSASSSSSSS